jgi:polar amino acid transport system substrate-binding protein
MKYIILVFLTLISVTFANQIELTEEEKEFIKKHPVIHLATSVSFEPFIIKNSNGSVFGHDKELLDLVTQKSGLKFKISTGNWDEVQEKAKQREFDGMSSAGFAKSREEYFNRSKSYLKLSTLIITHKDNL